MAVRHNKKIPAAFYFVGGVNGGDLMTRVRSFLGGLEGGFATCNVA